MLTQVTQDFVGQGILQNDIAEDTTEVVPEIHSLIGRGMLCLKSTKNMANRLLPRTQ